MRKPVVQRVEPDKAKPGDRDKFVVWGDLITNTYDVAFGVGVLVEKFTVVGDGKLVAELVISQTATVGARTVVLTNPRGAGTLVNGFTIVGSESTP